MAIVCALATAFGLLGWRLMQPQWDPFKAAAIADAPFPSLTYGAQTFLWWDGGEAGVHLDLVRLMSFSHVKQTFAWRDLEPQENRWDWTQADRILAEIERRGLRLVVRLGQAPEWARSPAAQEAGDAPAQDMSKWRAYCAAVAERYRGRISAYQIWNEPNLSREWGGQKPDPAAYVDLLAACSGAIRRVDPRATLISAGLAPTGNYDEAATPDDIYFDQMYRHGFQRYIDVAGVHAPGYAAPEIGPDDEAAKQRWFTFRRVEDLRKIMLNYGDEARQMAIMEFGYTTDRVNPDYQWFSVTERQQAEYLERAYEYAIANWRPWIGLMVLIYLPDPGWRPADEEYWWSILEPDGSGPRPAYITVANMRKVCGDFVIPERAADSPVALGKIRAPICPRLTPPPIERRLSRRAGGGHARAPIAIGGPARLALIYNGWRTIYGILADSMTANSTLMNMVKGRSLMTSRMSYFLVLLLLLLAALLRIHDLANLPLGFSEDEIVNIRLVDNVRQGDIFVFFPGEDGGREGAYHVFVAFVTSFVGEGTIGFRIASVWLSLLSIAIIYTLGSHLFNPIVGLLAAGLATVNMSGILLARAVSSDATALFLISATMLALARSLPVYRRTRVVTSNIVSFAALGGLLGAGLYLHPSSLFILLGAMAYIAYLLYVRNVMVRQRRSYTGFAILLMLIISMPYLISSINLPQYAAVQRVLSQYNEGIPRSIADGLLAIVANGDADPLRNLPGRPLVDAFSGLLMIAGIVVCALRRHRPRFMLMLITFICALPAALIVEDSPNFARMTVIFPHIAIFFGIGFYTVIRAPIFVDVVFRRMAVAGALILLAVNVVWTWTDLFSDWRDNEAVVPLVNGELGRIAHYLDAVGDETPVVFCNAAWASSEPEPDLSASDKTRLMMNRSQFFYRETDCRHTLLLTNGGAMQRVVFFDQAALAEAHPYLQEWLSHGQAVKGGVPRDIVIELETAHLLANRAGAFTTTAPVSYPPEVADPATIAPPIRFGGNLTFLGYEPTVERAFLPGESVDVITYWRVEGDFLPDILLKHHILADPVTPIGIRDIISVNPLMLRERDVFIQVTPVELRETTLPGRYIVSVGAYRQSDQERLPVLKEDQPHGDRIFLYHIEVLPAAESDESG